MHKASGAYRGALPKSLRQRLALLERGILLVPPRKTGPRAEQPAGKSRKRFVGASFGLGFVCGSLLGSAALLVLLFAPPEHARNRQALALPDASVALAPVPSAQPADESAHTAADTPPMPSLEMTLRPGDGGKARFPLHVTGADSADGTRVVLRNLPETAWFSSGDRQDEHTWALRLADLEDLHVTLGAGTPDAFDVAVEVTSAAGATAAKTIAHVRLFDRRDAAAGPVRPRSAAANIEDLLRRPSVVPQAPGVATPFRTEVQAVPPAEEPARVALSRPPLPEGSSSLGGPIGGTALPEEGRKVWWTMPVPAWAPFADGASGN